MAKTIICCRTSENNAFKLVRAANDRGLTLSELLDNVLGKYIREKDSTAHREAENIEFKKLCCRYVYRRQNTLITRTIKSYQDGTMCQSQVIEEIIRILRESRKKKKKLLEHTI
jgi:hypothetical protein